VQIPQCRKAIYKAGVSRNGQSGRHYHRMFDSAITYQLNNLGQPRRPRCHLPNPRRQLQVVVSWVDWPSFKRPGVRSCTFPCSWQQQRYKWLVSKERDGKRATRSSVPQFWSPFWDPGKVAVEESLLFPQTHKSTNHKFMAVSLTSCGARSISISAGSELQMVGLLGH